MAKSIIQTLKEENTSLKNQIEALKHQKEKLKADNNQLEADIIISVSRIKRLLDDLQIDLSKLKDKKALALMIPKVSRAVILGNLDFAYMDDLLPFLEKYNHLINK